MLCVSGQAVTIHFCVDMEIKMRPRRREITVGGGGGGGAATPIIWYNCLFMTLQACRQKASNHAIVT